MYHPLTCIPFSSRISPANRPLSPSRVPSVERCTHTGKNELPVSSSFQNPTNYFGKPAWMSFSSDKLKHIYHSLSCRDVLLVVWIWPTPLYKFFPIQWAHQGEHSRQCGREHGMPAKREVQANPYDKEMRRNLTHLCLNGIECLEWVDTLEFSISERFDGQRIEWKKICRGWK